VWGVVYLRYVVWWLFCCDPVPISCVFFSLALLFFLEYLFCVLLVPLWSIHLPFFSLLFVSLSTLFFSVAFCLGLTLFFFLFCCPFLFRFALFSLLFVFCCSFSFVFPFFLSFFFLYRFCFFRVGFLFYLRTLPLYSGFFLI